MPCRHAIRNVRSGDGRCEFSFRESRILAGQGWATPSELMMRFSQHLVATRRREGARRVVLELEIGIVQDNDSEMQIGEQSDAHPRRAEGLEICSPGQRLEHGIVVAKPERQPRASAIARRANATPPGWLTALASRFDDANAAIFARLPLRNLVRSCSDPRHRTARLSAPRNSCWKEPMASGRCFTRATRKGKA